jgi:tetratricopeptide (TPR) repeat protein
MIGEVNSDPKMATVDIEKLPEIPNLSTSALPLKAMLSRYYIRDKRFKDALHVLKESENANPFLHYNDFLRTSIYVSLSKFDSAHYYSKRAFHAWPRSFIYYKNLIFTSTKLKDTLELQRALNLSIKVNNDNAQTWNQYLLAMFELKKGADKSLLATLETTMQKFSGDTAILNPTLKLFRATNLDLQNLKSKAYDLFVAGKYMKSADVSLALSKQEPEEYSHLENVGICYYAANRFAESLIYLTKSEQHPGNNTGKSAYFAGMSQISIGKKSEACESFSRAAAKSYPDAAAALKMYCK